jgi:hypothetical protein
VVGWEGCTASSDEETLGFPSEARSILVLLLVQVLATLEADEVDVMGVFETGLGETPPPYCSSSFFFWLKFRTSQRILNTSPDFVEPRGSDASASAADTLEVRRFYCASGAFSILRPSLFGIDCLDKIAYTNATRLIWKGAGICRWRF